jgi:hypothetical protein
MIKTSVLGISLLLLAFLAFRTMPLIGQAGLNRIPLIQNPLVPTSTTTGGAQFTLTVNGNGFVSGAVANWDAKPRTTTFVSSSQLTVTIPATDIASSGTAVVTVSNPGGSTSLPALFEITNPVSTVGFTRTLDNVGRCSNLTGDFNGDGNPDLVSCNGSQIIILLGNGDGTFHAIPAISNPQGISPIFLAAADLNNDGKTDLVGFASVNPLDNQLVTLLGNGDGTFQSPVLSPASIEHQRLSASLALGDFNADGRIDLAVTFPNSGIGGGPGDLEIFLGNGDGTLQGAIVYPLSSLVPSHPNGLAVADFNRDGKLDLVVSDSGTDTVSILLGNGDGSFHTPTTIAAGGGQLATADLNGDGKSDLIVTGSASASVFLGNGDGTFGTVANFPTPSTTAAAQQILADLNGDGKLDLIVSIDLGISILLGNGDGTFQPQADFPLSTGTPKLAVADFNQDGKLDLAITEGVLLQTIVQPAPFGLNFGNQYIGTTSAAQPASLTNLATTTLTIGSASLAGANPGDFLIASNSCGTILASAAKCTVAITFSPTAKGLRTASLLFTDDASASPQTVALTGTGLGTAPPAGSFSPLSVTFSSQLVSMPSAPTAVTLTNTGDLTLVVNGTVFSGTNTSDFSQTNDCTGSGLPGGTSCTINVIFTPGATGTRTATLSIIDNAANSPQTIAVSGTGITDFSVSAATPSATITAGHTATYTLSLSPLGGFNQSVALTCTGAPAMSTCTVTPSTVSLNGAAAPVTVTVATVARSHAFSPPPGFTMPGNIKYLLIPMVFLLFGIARKLNTQGRRRTYVNVRAIVPAPIAAIAALLCLALTQTSCGGGATDGGGLTGTQAGTYTVSVTATSTSNSTAVTHKTNLTLIVE